MFAGTSDLHLSFKPYSTHPVILDLDKTHLPFNLLRMIDVNVDLK